MIIVYPRGQLTADDRASLKEAGIVAVEADDPKSVVTIVPSAPLVSGDALLLAALDGIKSALDSGSTRAATSMVASLHSMLNQEPKP